MYYQYKSGYSHIVRTYRSSMEMALREIEKDSNGYDHRLEPDAPSYVLNSCVDGFH